jgi:hypothetical protein
MNSDINGIRLKRKTGMCKNGRINNKPYTTVEAIHFKKSKGSKKF